jgi:6-phosphogluconolactonase
MIARRLLGCHILLGLAVSLLLLSAISPALAGDRRSFVYVANSRSNNVSISKIHTTTGDLMPRGEVAAGRSPIALAVHPSGRLFYALNEDSYDVSIYIMDPTTGGLTPLTTAETEAASAAITVNPNGRFAYVTKRQGASPSTTSHTLWRYVTDLMGRMTHVGTLKVGTSPVSVDLYPNGQFFYYVMTVFAEPNTNGGVSIRGVDRFNGGLTGRGSAQARSWPTAVAVDPSGHLAYVVNRDYRQLWMYSMAASTGLLTLLGIVGTGNTPTAVSVHSTGRFTYVTNSDDDTRSEYALAADGRLTLLGTREGRP